MKKQIFYFTGTGNSLSIASKIQNRLNDFSLHSIISDRELAEQNEDKQIIIVTPVYMFNIPYIVKEFIYALKGLGTCSIVYTGGGELGKCLKTAEKLFSKKTLTLSSQFNIPMPGNYTPMGCPEESKQKQQFALADSRLDEICHKIEKKDIFTDKSGTSFFETHLHPGILYSMGYKYIPYLGKRFHVESQCDGCGVCVKVCPAENIQLVDKKPQWSDKCEQCYACLQWCPKEAIQYGNKTSGVKRYTNPGVTLNEIISSNTKKGRTE